MFLIAVVLVVALVVLALVLWRLERRQNAGLEDPYWIVQLLVPVGVAGLLLVWLGQNASKASLFHVALPPDLIGDRHAFARHLPGDRIASSPATRADSCWARASSPCRPSWCCIRTSRPCRCRTRS